MVAHSEFGSPSFRLAAKGLVALHYLGKGGKDESSEADSVRDALDGPLNALDRAEEERAQWLSEDLYSVSEPSPCPREPLTPQAQRELAEAEEARRNRAWDRALTLLRRCQDHIPPAQLSFLRGSIWQEAGYPEVAAIFFGHASEMDPGNLDYRGLYLQALTASRQNA